MVNSLNLNNFIKKENIKSNIKTSNEKVKLKDIIPQSFENGISSIKLKDKSKLNTKIVKELLKLFKIEEIEAGIIKYYLKRNKLVTKNNFINDIQKYDSENKVYNYFFRLNESFDLSDIEKLFELLIPSENKRINGAIYTPPYIVDYILHNTINKLGTVCDCSCGAGAFLLGTLKYLNETYNQSIISLIENHIYGVDINPMSVRRSKIILSLYTIIKDEDVELIKFNIKVGNSLETNWDELFPKISLNKGFDFVVGNPPYVRIQDLKSLNKEALISKWETVESGNFNLYFAFFELGMKILNEDGFMGYISPNNYFTSLAGIQLRKWFYENKQIIKILNFNHIKIFENASTYTCITFLKKNNTNDFFEYLYLDNKESLKRLKNLEFSKYFFDWLDNKKWRLMSALDYHNINKIETIGTPLGEVCNIRVGIATLKDNIYFVEDTGDEKYCKTMNKDMEIPIEKSVTKKVIKISSINKEEEIPTNNRRIIFPYKKVGGKLKILDEEELKNKYPNCYEYLLWAKGELETRDKGGKNYPSWFAWGRVQGMNFKGQRLYTRTFYNKPDFMMDEEENNLFCNGYAIFCEKNIKNIQKILNSELMNYYIKKTSVEIEGNYQCYQKNFIEKFNILKFTDAEWKYIGSENNMDLLNKWLFEKYELKGDLLLNT